MAITKEERSEEIGGMGRDIHSSAGSRVMLRGRKYLRESLERAVVPVRWWWQRSRQSQGPIGTLAEGHHRTKSGVGGGGFPNHMFRGWGHLCVLIRLVSNTCQTIHNSLAGVEMSLCGDCVNK